MDQTLATFRPDRPPLPPGPFSVDEYDRLASDGVLQPGDRVELIEGEIVWMNAIGSPHTFVILGLTECLTSRVQRRAFVSIQNPVRLGHRSEPQPDVALLSRRPDRYLSGHAGPGDVLLLIEVADTSLEYDRNVKSPLCARHGIPEYWIVNLGENVVEVHRKPGPDGYGRSERFGPDRELTVEALPGLAVPVREFLP